MKGNPRRIKPLPRPNDPSPGPVDQPPAANGTLLAERAPAPRPSVTFQLDRPDETAHETAHDVPASSTRAFEDPPIGGGSSERTAAPATNGLWHPRPLGSEAPPSHPHPARAFLAIGPGGAGSGKSKVFGSMIFGDTGLHNSNAVTDQKVVTINCGGTLFQTFVRTLRRIPKTRLYKMTFEEVFLETGFAFFDRNPICFAAILEYCRSDRLEMPVGVSEEMWKEELSFYNIHSQTFYGPPNADENPLRPSSPPFKVAMWDFLEDAATSFGARVYSCMSLIVVLAATTFFVLESMPEFSSLAWKNFFSTFEAASIIFFTVEYVARLISSRRRVKFVLSLLNIVDLSAILPYYITMALPAGGSGGLGVLRVVRLTKVFRVLRIGKYSKGLQLLLQTLAHSSGELSVMGLFLFIGVLLFGSFVYMTESAQCEQLAESSPDSCGTNKFDSIPKGMWWAIVTLTTVGYGDSVPDTTPGKFVAATAICIGVMMLAGPVAVMSSTFGLRYHSNLENERKKVDVDRQQRNMLRIKKMRGKHAFWQNLQMILLEDSGQSMVSLPAYRRLMAELFKKFDTDESGSLEFSEIKEAVSTMGVDMDDTTLHALVDEADISKNGSLDIQEFTLLITQAALDQERSALPAHFEDLLISALEQMKPGSSLADGREDQNAQGYGRRNGDGGHTVDGGSAYYNLRPVTH